VKVGSTILPPKQYDIVDNGIMLHLQRRREPELFHWLEKLWEQFSGILKGAYWLVSCPERKLSLRLIDMMLLALQCALYENSPIKRYVILQHKNACMPQY
jgi:hypothetical protein